VSRRSALRGMGLAAGGAALASAFPAPFVRAQAAPVKIGLMLPYSGTFARLGQAITNGIELRVQEAGGMLGGRKVEFVKQDSEAAPPKATQLATKLINSDKVDFLVGPVHSGVAMGMAKVARDEETIMVVPNAGADQITRQFCAPNIFRTSFTNWQPPHPMGKVLMDRGLKNVVLCYWDYGAGQQAMQGFRDGFEPLGGTIVEDIGVPFPDVEFQAVLTNIASIKPDAVFTFFAGGGAVKFVTDYAALGLKDSIPLFGSGFLTEGVTQAQGEAAEGIQTGLHYADTLDLPENKRFREAYSAAFEDEPDVYAVQGYDAAHLMEIGLGAVEGDTMARADMIAAMEKADFASPRGPFKMSPSHNPVQNIYLREVRNGVNEVVETIAEGLSDPGTGCSLS
jgi:branched-chain amino acid transport system substrate-binding protein